MNKRALFAALLSGIFLAGGATAMSRPPDWYPPTPAILPMPLDGAAFSIREGRVVWEEEKAQLTYTLVLANDTAAALRGEVAVPFLDSVNDLDERRNGLSILLNGEAADGSYRFAHYPSLPFDPEQRVDAMEQWRSVSLAAGLDELGREGPYRLTSFDPDASVNGYEVRPVVPSEDAIFRCRVGYDPGRTKLLVDPGDSGDLREIETEDGAEVELELRLKEGEGGVCSVYFVGEDTLAFRPDPRQGGEVPTAPAPPVTPRELMDRYRHQYDYEHTEQVQAAGEELTARYVDRVFMSGGSFLDVSKLSYKWSTTAFLSAVAVPVELAAGETATLRVIQRLSSGLVAFDREEDAERLAVISTEPLGRWAAVGPIAVEVQTTGKAKSLRATSELERKRNHVYTGILNLAEGENLYIGLFGGFHESDNGALVFLPFIIWHYFGWLILLLLAVIAAIIFRKGYKKRRGQT